MPSSEFSTVALQIAAFVIPLGIDTFAIAIALGLRGLRPLRPASVFAAFEVTMPLIGIAAGRYIGSRSEALAAYLGGVVLIAVGLHTLREVREHDDHRRKLSFETVPGVLAAGLGISTDEIAIGFPLGALRLPVGMVLAAIAVQAFLVTIAGILIGHRIGAAVGLWASRGAAAVAGAAFVLLGCYLIAARIFS